MDRQLEQIKYYLDEQYQKYCYSAFIDDDPIQIPHSFTDVGDVEISGLFAATFAWGVRKTIISKSKELMSRMDNDPYSFIVNHSSSDLNALKGFKHRTFSFDDACAFVEVLSQVYKQYATFDEFLLKNGALVPEKALRLIRTQFEMVLGVGHPSLRHVANIDAGSAAKRLNMYFRWMVRTSCEGVDFGLWKSMASSDLLIPLDLHVGNTARELGILTRKQNDFKAAVELTHFLRKLDPFDPIKYDFALFSLGVNSKQVK